VNILGNNIGAERAQELVKIVHSHSTITTLCGLSGEEIELDLSGMNLREDGVILLANELRDHTNVQKLDLRNNKILSGTPASEKAEEALGDMLKHNTVLKELNLSSNCSPTFILRPGYMDRKSCEAEFAEGLSARLESDGVLSKLDLSNNQIISNCHGDQKINSNYHEEIKALFAAKGVVLAL
jgi:Leucine-rich repeat (LRR) protein